MNYSPSDAFETLPFPEPEKLACLDELGKELLLGRRDACGILGVGLTDLYNRFHDPGETDVKLAGLRGLIASIDTRVADIYGWNDLPLDHDFHEVDYLPENDRVRYTVSREVRIEILKRLSMLNQERYEEEVAQGLHGAKRAPKPKTPKKSAAPASAEQQGINFGDADSEAAE